MGIVGDLPSRAVKENVGSGYTQVVTDQFERVIHLIVKGCIAYQFQGNIGEKL
jgi:hypothetical protein